MIIDLKNGTVDYETLEHGFPCDSLAKTVAPKLRDYQKNAFANAVNKALERHAINFSFANMYKPMGPSEIYASDYSQMESRVSAIAMGTQAHNRILREGQKINGLEIKATYIDEFAEIMDKISAQAEKEETKRKESLKVFGSLGTHG